MMFELIAGGVGIVGLIVVAIMAYVILSLRRVVPTNMVHIVQTGKKTIAYGKGKDAGNSYYAWPLWIPVVGVTVTEFPESIFRVSLSDYEAYDATRLPFIVDVTAFFRVDLAETAAQRVANFGELESQLMAVLQGSVRRILATNKLEDIMQARSSLGMQFTEEVQRQIQEWGVLPVKTIEFMDIRDSKGSNVIANIMAKEKSRIEMESRVEVAQNQREAQLKEIDAQRTVEVQKQDAIQQVGLRTAEKDKAVGIADEQAKQEIKMQAKVTAEKNMAVIQVEQVRSAEIAKEVAIVEAEKDRQVLTVNAEAQKTAVVTKAVGDKESVVVKAEGDLAAAKNKAEGDRAMGFAAADAEKAMLMAPVETQITLAKEIGENEGYQNYLITIKKVEVGGQVGLKTAEALGAADLKIIANAGDVMGGIGKLGDALSTSGGTNFAGMLAALAQTSEGQALVGGLVDRISGAPSKK
jgi:flotillin